MENTQLIVHRKGATRAFPQEVPEKYRSVGQPVLFQEPWAKLCASWF